MNRTVIVVPALLAMSAAFTASCNDSGSSESQLSLTPASPAPSTYVVSVPSSSPQPNHGLVVVSFDVGRERKIATVVWSSTTSDLISFTCDSEDVPGGSMTSRSAEPDPSTATLEFSTSLDAAEGSPLISIACHEIAEPPRTPWSVVAAASAVTAEEAADCFQHSDDPRRAVCLSEVLETSIDAEGVLGSLVLQVDDAIVVQYYAVSAN